MAAGIAAFVSFGVAFAMLALLVSKFSRIALDQPNERSLHERPVPRTGGIAILAGMLTSIAFGVGTLWLPLGLAVALAALSFLDDLYTLGALPRLGAHLAAAAVLVWYVMSPMHPLELVLLAVAITWLTNLYNFMDGSDGLAGGMAVVGFGTYALAAALGDQEALAMLAAALSAAAAAFLCFNFPPARIFLGDVGSVPLGFLAGALGIVGWRDDLWPLWLPVLAFAPFIADASATLVRRALRREPVWRAHREHYYQRLVRSGFGHRGTALIAYALMFICAALALYGRSQAPVVQWACLAIGLVVLLAVAVWIDMRWAHYNRKTGVPA